MPSLVMLPFIQCHHTRGRALWGGFSKPLLSGSPLAARGACAMAGRIDKAARSKPAEVGALREFMERAGEYMVVMGSSSSECFRGKFITEAHYTRAIPSREFSSAGSGLELAQRLRIWRRSRQASSRAKAAGQPPSGSPGPTGRS